MRSNDLLRRAQHLNGIIEADITEIERLKELSLRVKGIGYGEKVQTSKNLEPPFVKCIETIERMEEELAGKVQELLEIKRIIFEKLEPLSQKEQLVLRYRYIENMEWRDVAEKMGVSTRTLHRIHASAIKKII